MSKSKGISADRGVKTLQIAENALPLSLFCIDRRWRLHFRQLFSVSLGIENMLNGFLWYRFFICHGFSNGGILSLNFENEV